ncbi:AzlC family ABC transporter permease [Saccharopolyspora sp. HNM0983]|uniref:AzlC family ABC transporter permease n=1 Tax=Saccharopolyspora montiporae TaxID=2781240 RepID=A0A929B570_9PSEU|nr:AzlC family ABC transporter permease [Saccharopolyspora sp. HNM0983]MBE9373369.1 AzlC family ABC transporter permease [Saccharopolyspora sp. HNM0983]
MKTLQRTPGALRDPLLRDVLSVAVAMAVVGASLGAIAVSSGVPLWLITLTAAVVFAGGSEFMAVGLLTAGAAPLTAVVGGLLLNARHLPFGLAIGGVLDRGWPSRLVGSHLLVDESVAFALAQDDPAQRRRAFWTTGIALYCAWAPSVFLGGLLGTGIGDPEAFGLDAALPAALLALVVPKLSDRPTLRAVLVGVAVALLSTPVLPEGLPVVAGLVGVAAAAPLPAALRRRRA